MEIISKSKWRSHYLTYTYRGVSTNPTGRGLFIGPDGEFLTPILYEALFTMVNDGMTCDYIWGNHMFIYVYTKIM